ncbi:hypothetical protein [Paenibacillus contaminans]|uniref:Uncharacterized protein n=1 Tax=Paenibacillus contaminans TaxID=450362 RepID=A0A329MSB5_9BACL|nr:hypothetical protein [Paenibacillus contaminans]RAV22684.1 hypothetical protein DQG23_00235 [Paenibacillus contaminans]
MDDLIKKITEQQKEVVRAMVKKERRGRSSAVSVGSGQSQAYTEFQMKKNQSNVDKIPTLETSISSMTTDINNMKTSINALQQNVGANVIAEITRINNNLLDISINLMKNTMDDRIRKEKEDVTKPLSQMNNFVVDSLDSAPNIDTELSMNCFWDGRSKTIKSTTAVNKRPIFTTDKKSSILSEGGAIFYVPRKTFWNEWYAAVYLLTRDFRLIHFGEFSHGAAEPNEIEIINKELLSDAYGEITGAFAPALNKYFFTTTLFAEFKLFALDLNTYHLEEISAVGDLPMMAIDGNIMWWDATFNVLAFNGGYNNDGDFFIYNPSNNSMTRSYWGMWQLDESSTQKAYNPQTNKFIHFIPDQRQLYQYFVSNGTDIIMSDDFIQGVVPQIYNAKCFVKDNELIIMYPGGYNENVYKINIDSKSFMSNTDFRFEGRKVADYSSWLGYVEIIKDENNNMLENPIRSILVINMVDEAKFEVDNSISAWRYKYKGNGEYNPSDPENQAAWTFITEPLLTTKVLNWGYNMLASYQNKYGQLVGIYYSRDNGTTWSSAGQVEQLVSISNQPNGQNLRLKIVAKHDYEIIWYGFGGME